MFSNYLKIAWRSLKRNRFYTIINVLGLAVDLTSFILILLFVKVELAYDRCQLPTANCRLSTASYITYFELR